MSTINRREFLQLAAAIGATAVWGDPFATVPGGPWRERRDLFPEGVASGDEAGPVAAVSVRSSKAGIDLTSPVYTAPPWVRLIEPARSSASRSRRIVLSETPNTRTSSSKVA